MKGLGTLTKNNIIDIVEISKSMERNKCIHKKK
jgi:hypothetical protein